MGLIGRLLAWSFVHAPFAAELWSQSRRRRPSPLFVTPIKPLSWIRLGLVTTGGVHHTDQPPFRRKGESARGDGTWRRLDLQRLRGSFAITHDWYDKEDAE
jgi:hypothetical protein